jgi:branched-chain amino acid transport system substrate-binding protein
MISNIIIVGGIHMKRTFSILLAMMLLLTVLAPSVVASEETIKIGLLATLTGYPLNGEHMAKGAQMAVDEINEAGGILGKKVELDIQDVGNTTDVGINSCNLLISNKVVSIVGPHYSSTCLAIENLINAAKIPMLVGGTSPKIAKIDNDYLFRIRASDTMQAVAAAKYLVEGLGAKNVAILYGSDDFGTGGMEIASEHFSSVGVDWVAHPFNNEDTDVTTQILKCITSGCDSVMIWATEAAYPIVARQLYELGLIVPTITNPSLAVDSCLAQLEQEWVEDWYCVTDFLTSNSEEKVQNFIKAYEAKYGTEESVDLHCAAYYSGVKLVADAIERAGSTDTDAIRNALMETKDFEGIIGTMNPNENGEFIHEIILAQCNDLKVSYIKTIGE